MIVRMWHMPCFYLTPTQDNFNQELQVCIAEALYDVDSIVADPGATGDLTQSDRIEPRTGVGPLLVRLTQSPFLIFG